METWRHGELETSRVGDLETLTGGELETWRLGELESWRPGVWESWRVGEHETWRAGDFEQGFLSQDSSARNLQKNLFGVTAGIIFFFGRGGVQISENIRFPFINSPHTKKTRFFSNPIFGTDSQIV